MQRLIITGRAFYAIALIVYGIQQLYFGTFRDVFFSVYQQQLPLLNVFAYLFGLYLITTGILILLPGKGRRASLILGAVFITLLIGTHLSYALISETNKLYHLGLWTNPLKELALAGGAFVLAHSYGANDVASRGLLEKMIPYGNLLFLVTITSFGVAHIVYSPFLAGTVPEWMANREFWILLTGVTLIASGLAIIFGIRIRAIALLLSLQIFLWIWMVHVPGTLATSLTANRGNSLASTFDAFAFSGTALLISMTMKKQQWVEYLERLGEPEIINL